MYIGFRRYRGRRAAEPATQSLNMAWVLGGGFLVMFMQVGFAMLETGFTRSKNAVNTMAMNLVIYPIGLIGFWLAGYAPSCESHPPPQYPVPV